MREKWRSVLKERVRRPWAGAQWNSLSERYDPTLAEFATPKPDPDMAARGLLELVVRMHSYETVCSPERYDN